MLVSVSVLDYWPGLIYWTCLTGPSYVLHILQKIDKPPAVPDMAALLDNNNS